MLDFSVFLNYAGQLGLTAVVVEALTEIIKNNLPEGLYARLNADAKKLIALLVSVICFAVAPLEPFASAASNVVINLIAIVVVSRGANGFHDFLKLIRGMVEERQS